MAKAFFLNIPAHGHVNPTLLLVQELVNRCETIIYYTGEEFREKVEITRAEFRTYDSLGEAVRFQFADYDVQSTNMVLMARIMIQFTEDMLPPLLDVLRRERPEYILHDFTCIWGLLAAEIMAIHAVAIIPQFPINYQTRPDPYPGMWRDLLWNFVAGIPHLWPFSRVARSISAGYETRPITLMKAFAPSATGSPSLSKKQVDSSGRRM